VSTGNNRTVSVGHPPALRGFFHRFNQKDAASKIVSTANVLATRPRIPVTALSLPCCDIEFSCTVKDVVEFCFKE
jgi:hypothetical protein